MLVVQPSSSVAVLSPYYTSGYVRHTEGKIIVGRMHLCHCDDDDGGGGGGGGVEVGPDQTPRVCRLSEAGDSHSRCSGSAADTLHSTHGETGAVCRVDPARLCLARNTPPVCLSLLSHAVHNSAVSQSVTVARSRGLIIKTNSNKIVTIPPDNDTCAFDSDTKNNVFHIRL